MLRPATLIVCCIAALAGSPQNPTPSAPQPSTGEVPPQNELAWWDADTLREIVSRGTVAKWKGASLARIEGRVPQVADLAGDWREEIVTFVNGELSCASTRRRFPPPTAVSH